MTTPVRLHSVAQVARLAGVSRRAMLRRLLSQHARAGGAWLVTLGGTGRGRRLWVNLEQYRAAHPESFPPVDPAELARRVVVVEEAVRELGRRQRGQGARLRALEAARM